MIHELYLFILISLYLILSEIYFSCQSSFNINLTTRYKTNLYKHKITAIVPWSRHSQFPVWRHVRCLALSGCAWTEAAGCCWRSQTPSQTQTSLCQMWSLQTAQSTQSWRTIQQILTEHSDPPLCPVGQKWSQRFINSTGK